MGKIVPFYEKLQPNLFQPSKTNNDNDRNNDHDHDNNGLSHHVRRVAVSL